MNIEDYCTRIESKKQKPIFNEKIQHDSSDESSEELDHKYIIENCPSTKIVRSYFRNRLDIDDTPEFLKD
ncbi:MAG: hypothetical protein KAT68_11775 [Bacteroidales bacterium]|nr:hypothetical protein [Bacteroidales bacterium]